MEFKCCGQRERKMITRQFVFVRSGMERHFLEPVALYHAVRLQ